MLPRTVSLNRNVSSKTMPTAWRSSPSSQIADVHAVESDCAVLHVVEPGQQPGDGGLAAARRTDQRDALPGADGQVEAVEDRRGRVVAEAHVAGSCTPPTRRLDRAGVCG